MAILGRRGSSMGRVKQQAAPIQPQVPPSKRAATTVVQPRMSFTDRVASARAKQQAAPAGSPVQQRADVRAMAASTPKGSPVAPGGAAQQMSAMGPKMPAMANGGMAKKKTGYAKGGAVMCGASMPPAQKRKK